MKKLFSGLISPNIKAIVSPLLILAVVTFLALFGYQFGSQKIFDQRTKLAEAQAVEKTLKEKDAILSQIQNEIQGFVDAAAIAVPDSNPAILLVSHFRNLSLEQGVVITSIKGGAEAASQGNIPAINIDLEIEAPIPAIINFLKAVKTIAPLTAVDKAKLNQSSNGARAEITFRSYFSLFPERLPSLTDSITGLSVAGRETLSELEALIKPTFINLSPQPKGERLTPFD